MHKGYPRISPVRPRVNAPEAIGMTNIASEVGETWIVRGQRYNPHQDLTPGHYWSCFRSGIKFLFHSVCLRELHKQGQGDITCSEDYISDKIQQKYSESYAVPEIVELKRRRRRAQLTKREAG